MITGFNTDIEYDGVVYHVQTEDKGPSTPIILSLVYDRGTILASKRVPYDDIATDEVDEQALAERLQRQHKLICAAVLAGRIDDLKEMTAKASKSTKARKAASKNGGNGNAPVSDIAVEVEPDVVVIDPGQPVFESFNLEFPIPMPDFGELQNFTPIEKKHPTLIEDVEILDERSEIPVEEVEIISGMAGSARPEHDNLGIDLIDDSGFRGGESKSVCILVCRGSRREVVRGAEIMVKVLGSSFKPVICHALSDKNGLAKVKIKVPSFQSGRAVLTARAINAGEEVEIRRPVSHG